MPKGNYELMICHRNNADWGANLISRLAYYTLEVRLDPGETMDIGKTAPPKSTIKSLLFVDYARLNVLDKKCGLLLCIGLTTGDLEICQDGRSTEVISALKCKQVFPFTDFLRENAI